MKPGFLTASRLLAVIAVAGISITLLAWQQKQHKLPSSQQKSHTDTIPKNKEVRERKIRDLDEVLDELEKTDIEIDLKNLEVELSKIGPQIEKELSLAKIEVEKAVKEIDLAKIKTEIAASLAEVDWDKMKIEINTAMDKVDWEKMNKELEKVKEIDMENIKVDMKELEKEMKKIKPGLEKEMAKVKVEVEKAKAEIKEYKTFVNGLENDGLINKKEGYTIKHKNGALIINGKTQPAGVYNKYRSFLEKHKTLTIEKTDDDFNIDNDDEDIE